MPQAQWQVGRKPLDHAHTHRYSQAVAYICNVHGNTYLCNTARCITEENRLIPECYGRATT